MTVEEAKVVLTEMNRWMRGEGEYTKSQPDLFRNKPYTNKVFEEAIDVAIKQMSF